LTTGNKVVLDETGVGGVCLTSWDGKLFIAWTGSDSIIRATRSVNGQDNWTPCNLPAASSRFAPAIGSSEQASLLIIAWTDAEDGRINTMFSISGHAFFPHTTLAERSVAGPSIVQQSQGSPSNIVGIVWAGIDQAKGFGRKRVGRVHYMSLNADGTTSDKETLEERTDATPQRILSSFLPYSLQWMATYCWRSIDGQLNFGHYTFGPLGQHGPFYKSLIGEQSIGGPSLVSAEDAEGPFQFYVFWTRTDPEGQLDYRLLPP
jgi:hypothetical protein